MSVSARRLEQDPIRITTEAVRAARACALRPLVVILEPGAIDQPVGSGTLVRTRTGCAVLTCKHVLAPPHDLVARHASGLSSEIVDMVAHPTLDLAVATLRDPDRLAAEATTPARIARAERFPLTNRDPILVLGFPKQTVDEAIDADGRVTHRAVRHISYLTRLRGTSSDVLSIQWDEGEPDDYDTWDYARGIPQEHRVHLKKPSGLSGGAVWTFQPIHDGRMGADRISSLVAVPHEFTNKRQLALPAARWRTWLMATLAAI
jgi:hypothetical protein